MQTELWPEVALDEIPRDECFELLAQAPIGRLAVNGRAGSPLVVPVNFVVDREDIVFRSDPGRKLRDVVDRPVSFEIDAIDPVHRTGWSVLVEGIAYESEPPAGVELEPWAPGPKAHWVRVVPGSISGRRIRRSAQPPDPRAYV